MSKIFIISTPAIEESEKLTAEQQRQLEKLERLVRLCESGKGHVRQILHMLCVPLFPATFKEGIALKLPRRHLERIHDRMKTALE